MIRTLILTLAFLCVVGNSALFGQKNSTAPAESPTDKMKVEDTKPKVFDMFFLVKEDKPDTAMVKAVVGGMYQRLVATGLTAGTDFQVYVGHDTIQVRLTGNTRDVTDWYSLLVRQGLLRVHLADDSLYAMPVDTAKIPAGNVIMFEPDMKTRRYVGDRFLNGKLVNLLMSVEQFDRPVLSCIVVPNDTAYKSFLFTKGMRIATCVDGVVFSSALVSSDSASITQFPIATQYPASLTYVIDRAVRFPLPRPVEFLGWRKTEEKQK
jgi:hypothetical protein